MIRPVAVLAFTLLSQALEAQGVTTAAIEGTVLGQDGSPIQGAKVRAINTSNGRRWETTTPSSGRYALEDVAIGGPYSLEIHALGFAPETRAELFLALGQLMIVNFSLQPAAIQLSPVTIIGAVDPILNAGRSGPAEIISSRKISALPNLGRDLVTLILLSPQAAISPTTRFGNEGVTFAGQSRALNEFQVDGGVNHDLYTGRTQPGLQTWPRPISLEAVEEIQVLTAPLDVRYSGFAGGLVNAVTKSGTNAVHGSMFAYLSDASLVGLNATGARVDDFTVLQFGATLGGPIVRDRVHFFVSADISRRTIPDAGPLITDSAGGADLSQIGIRYASAARFQDILRNSYGLDPGTLGPYEGRVPAADVFAKTTVQLGTNSHVELSHHYIRGERRTYIDRQFGTYYLSSVGQRVPANENASRLIWASRPGSRLSNEVIVSYLQLGEACRPNVTYPIVNVLADQGTLVAGTGIVCPASSAQNAIEVTENLTLTMGSHLITLGAHAEALNFKDTQLQGSAGLWNFRNLDSLAVGHGGHYERTLAGPSWGSGLEFRAREIGIYFQDRWQPTHSLTLTAGLRMDVPYLPDKVATNQSLRTALGADNGRLPAGNPLLSPRFGFNYDRRALGRTFVRGGIGVFTGRMPYAWVASAYRDDGQHQLFLRCDGAEVPQFDPLNQPATCVSGVGATPRISFFGRDVKFPQSLKTFLGVDHRLSADMIGTVDFLYTRALHQLYYSDANLPAPVGAAQGEGNRPLYGTISAVGVARPALRSAPLGQVIRASNLNGDKTVSVSTQLRRKFGDRGELSALYAHTRARDRMTVASVTARINLESAPLDGTMEHRRLGTSAFEIPHRVEAVAALRLPHQVRLSLRYSGASGTAYTYTVRGDVNADGIGTGVMVNDIVYVPRDRSDISIDGNGTVAGFGTALEQDSVYYNVLDPFIERDPCLRRQRGRILARNSCRNPWFGTLNARVTKAFPTMTGQSLELTADIYNVLNILNRNWGQYRVTNLDPSQPMLFLSGYDAPAGRGIYRPLLPSFRQVQDLASRWQLELGARYTF
jgi:hypothetical protein